MDNNMNQLHKPNVSIIIPVYNLEKTLSRCLDSIIAQTFQNIEIIIINDCSTDNSEAIILKYAKQDNRIKYIKHNKNKGCGGAKNTGLDNVSAEWVIVIDADDYVANNMVEMLHNKALEYSVKMVQCRHKRFNEKLKPYSASPSQKKDIIIKNPFKEVCLANSLITYVTWNKIWHISLFNENNIRFLERVTCEDSAALIVALNTIDRMVLISDELYFYYFNDGKYTNLKNMSQFTTYYKYITDKISILSKNKVIDNALLDIFFTHQAMETKYTQIYLANKTDRAQAIILFKQYYGKYAAIALQQKNKWYQPDKYTNNGKIINYLKQTSQILGIYPLLLKILKK